MAFWMRVEDSFELRAGRTILVGEVISGPEFVSEPIDCELVISGDVVQRFALRGEEMPKKLAPSAKRSVWTDAVLSLTSDDLRTSTVELREAR